MTFTKYIIAASAAVMLTSGAVASAKNRENRTAVTPASSAAVRDHRGEPHPPLRDASNGYGAGRVIRDHRSNPQPWSMPRHWHRH